MVKGEMNPALEVVTRACDHGWRLWRDHEKRTANLRHGANPEAVLVVEDIDYRNHPAREIQWRVAVRFRKMCLYEARRG